MVMVNFLTTDHGVNSRVPWSLHGHCMVSAIPPPLTNKIGRIQLRVHFEATNANGLTNGIDL